MKEKAMSFPTLPTMKEIQESLDSELTQEEKAECWDSLVKDFKEASYKSTAIRQTYEAFLLREISILKKRSK